ncbi:MAG: hypothetical protein C0625_02915 [Arcobacter sp.]|nr:MAG: hypothetical protein C0625_02915 [Arcobacter sp.]
MKKALPILTILIFIGIIIGIFLSMSSQKQMVVIYENNHKHKPVDIKLSHFQDTQCGMTLSKLEDSVQAISPDGKTWFFDDIGCFALWYKNISFQKDVIIWVYTRDTKEYIRAREAWYTQTDKTEMGYGFASHKIKKEKMISFDDMILKMFRGENMKNPLIRKKLLGY